MHCRANNNNQWQKHYCNKVYIFFFYGYYSCHSVFHLKHSIVKKKNKNENKQNKNKKNKTKHYKAFCFSSYRPKWQVKSCKHKFVPTIYHFVQRLLGLKKRAPLLLSNTHTYLASILKILQVSKCGWISPNPYTPWPEPVHPTSGWGR